MESIRIRKGRKGSCSSIIKNLPGRVINKLTVLQEDISTSIFYTHWICRCTCGKVIKVFIEDLLQNKVYSCGCVDKPIKKSKKNKPRTKPNRVRDLTSKSINHLTVISLEKDDYDQSVWRCKCVCGKGLYVKHRDIRKYNNSCGCIKNKKRGPKAKDLSNKIIGKLLVLSKVDRKGAINYWKCLCDCGRTKVVSTAYLTSKRKDQSCGCLIGIDLTGHTINNFTVIKMGKLMYRNSRKVKYWSCKCECGTVKDIRQDKLISGIIKSCGCKTTTFVGRVIKGWKVISEVKQSKPGKIDNYICKCSHCDETKTFSRLDIIKKEVRTCHCYIKLRDMETSIRRTEKCKSILYKQNKYLTVTHAYYVCDVLKIICRCKCGNIVRTNNVYFKKTNSCGCLRKEQKEQKLRANIGKVHEKLTIIGVSKKGKEKYREFKYVCKCACGNTTRIDTQVWTKQQSCGCARVLSAKTRSGENHYNWKGGKYNKLEKIRRGTDYKKWRAFVFLRDDYTCQKCSLKHESTSTNTKTLSAAHRLTAPFVTARF